MRVAVFYYYRGESALVNPYTMICAVDLYFLCESQKLRNGRYL